MDVERERDTEALQAERHFLHLRLRRLSYLHIHLVSCARRRLSPAPLIPVLRFPNHTHPPLRTNPRTHNTYVVSLCVLPHVLQAEKGKDLVPVAVPWLEHRFAPQ